MRGREFVDRVFELGAERDVSVRIDTKRGKGSHATLYYGTRKTVVKDRRKELAPGPSVRYDPLAWPRPE